MAVYATAMSDLPPLDSLPGDVMAQVSAARIVLERHLAEVLEAMHVFGSAVQGGLKPRSDIDVLVTVSSPLAEETRRPLLRDLLAVSAPPGARGPLWPLEVTIVVRDEVVPWRYPPRREMQFGEWIREEIEAGRCEPAAVDPDLGVLLTKVRLASVCMGGKPAAELFDEVPAADLARSFADTLAQWSVESDWQGDEQTVVLALARIWYSAVNGSIAAKDVAAAWALERLPADLRPVLAAARDAYLGAAEDTLAAQPAAVAGFVRFAQARIRPLLAG